MESVLLGIRWASPRAFPAFFRSLLSPSVCWDCRDALVGSADFHLLPFCFSNWWFSVTVFKVAGHFCCLLRCASKRCVVSQLWDACGSILNLSLSAKVPFGSVSPGVLQLGHMALFPSPSSWASKQSVVFQLSPLTAGSGCLWFDGLADVLKQHLYCFSAQQVLHQASRAGTDTMISE